jgi:hypothetical protein
MHATFFQKVILCAVAGFLAASLIQWAKGFVEGCTGTKRSGKASCTGSLIKTGLQAG